MAAIKETIAVIDKSGKMVSNSKHLFGVFKEARNAYRERKAEIRAVKDAEKQAQMAEQEARRIMANLTLDDKRSVASSRKSGRTRASQNRHSSGHSQRIDVPSRFQYEQDLHHGQLMYQEPRSLEQTGRRHTTQEMTAKESPTAVARSQSNKYVDMDLAYGDAHPLALQHYEQKPVDEEQLNGLVAKAKGLLEEADCLQHTATTTMAHLQKNPDAMAAVALTLAEISNLTSKMAPSILAGLKLSAPSVFALLSSPQFLIAAGVGVGVTIVMFGGYKIIKKLTAAPTMAPMEAPAYEFAPLPKAPSASADELLELQSEHLSRVEVWRRGVADYEASSVGSTVDGEFITPKAAMMSGLDLSDPTIFRHRGLDAEEESTASSRRSKHSRQSRHSRNSSSKAGSSKGGGSKSRAGGSTTGESRKKKTTEPKKPSRLRMMFTA
ncbi:hypothetical protein TMatcc_003273 [Talaromyces marneffei ATCC 18224]|uniref:Uncharacterized protein n=2 Tax=Talaromyces marneffei TaxID=37727 RepID=B6Q578_TALMQ|nr:uncharacterized protein EYB26_001664 [Talaromyces marneffei]EEA28397.1 conserved hypothetical protein [Talaromyces marneffei ATCC 18224]QGA14012.1 hypothetical protein EYB26_001664 [Talaromyces marneffei]